MLLILIASIERSGNEVISVWKWRKALDPSMQMAMHFGATGRTLSGVLNDRPAMAAISYSESSHISCVGNDYGYEIHSFLDYVEALGPT